MQLPAHPFTKEVIDTRYSEISEYMDALGYTGPVHSRRALLFAVSQSEEICEPIGASLSRNLPMTECFNDLSDSCEVMQCGFHKLSVAALRLGLEDGLMAAYWRSLGHNHPDFTRWLHSRARTPQHNQRLWQHLLSHEGVRQVEQAVGLREEAEQVWDTLNAYVHTRGWKHSTMSDGRRAWAAQNTNANVEEWYGLFDRVTRLVVLLQLLVRPALCLQPIYSTLVRKFGASDHFPFCGVLFSDCADSIIECVGASEYELASDIAKRSPEYKRVRESITQMPDLTWEIVEQRQRNMWRSMDLDDTRIRAYIDEAKKILQSAHRES